MIKTYCAQFFLDEHPFNGRVFDTWPIPKYTWLFSHELLSKTKAKPRNITKPQVCTALHPKPKRLDAWISASSLGQCGFFGFPEILDWFTGVPMIVPIESTNCVFSARITFHVPWLSTLHPGLLPIIRCWRWYIASSRYWFGPWHEVVVLSYGKRHNTWVRGCELYCCLDSIAKMGSCWKVATWEEMDVKGQVAQ